MSPVFAIQYDLPTITIDSSSCLEEEEAAEGGTYHDDTTNYLRQTFPIDEKHLYVSLYLTNSANKHAGNNDHDNQEELLSVDQFDAIRTKRLSQISMSSNFSAFDSFSNIETPLPTRMRQFSYGGCAPSGETPPSQKV